MKPLRDDRLASLDALRGFAIGGMVLVNNPGDWQALYAPLAHARWHGWTFTDWIFPFFLFAVGVSMTLSLSARAAAGAPRPRLLVAMARRSALIFAIGLALNAVPSFDWATLRIPGVLQRIALASLLAAPFVLALRARGLALAALGWCAVYTLPMLLWPVPDAQGVVAAGVLEPGRDFGAWIDRQVFGPHLWRASRTWDPEGLWSTLPAVATVLLGAVAGRWLAGGQGTPAARTVWLLLAGLAAAWAGEVLGRVLMPINKNLWTPSYVLFTAGWAAVALGTFHWLMDAAPEAALRQRARRLLHPLVIYGVNALAVFVVSGLLARLLLLHGPDGRSAKQLLVAPLQALPVSPELRSLLYALGFQAVMFAFAWVLWRRRWFFTA